MGEKRLKCMRMCLLIFNAIYSISGGILLGLGIWAAVEKLFLSQIIGNDLYSTASYLIIATGAILLIVSFLGCLGVCVEVRCMLLAYFLMLLLIFVCLVLSAILALVFHGEIEGTMKSAMKENLVSKYGARGEKSVSDAWDTTQRTFNCCAVDDGSNWDYSIYQQSQWFLDSQKSKPQAEQQYVPESCCLMLYDRRRSTYSIFNANKCQSFQFGPPRLSTAFASNDALNTKGCYKFGYDYVMKQSTIIMAIAITFAVCLVIGMVLAICVWRLVPPSEYGPTSSAVV